MSDIVETIQSTDGTDTATAARNLVENRIETLQERETLEVEATVRELLSKSEDALAGAIEERPEAFLSALHWYLWLDPARDDVLDPAADLDNAVQKRFRRHHRDRERGRRPDPMQEYETAMEIAKAQGYITAASDKSPRAPITLEHLDKKGVRSLVNADEVVPIGRKKIPKDSSASIEYHSEEIPHESCDHILTTASPRQGKDATNARICGNLKDQHGYKWVSILDDGRNELPMIATPNDERAIQKSLEKLGQEPKAYQTEVYVPAMPGLPDKLPGNFVPFTVGVDDLTPELVLRLAGKTSSGSRSERRIREALKTTERQSGSVQQLVGELNDMAGEMEATVTLENEDVDEQIREISYQMEEDETLQRAANTIAQYAADGLIEDVGVKTNLEMEEILKDQETVTVLNCNYLEEGQQALRLTIMDLWMQLIWREADERKTVGRIALEIRELKNVAPSQPQNMKYSAERRATAQTLFEIASQGGSRGILMVGSTQKVNDVRRQIRVNMRNKIVLSNEDEGINVLKESIDLKGLESAIKDFDKGQGLISTPKFRAWPVRFAGARCGLGDKDRGWLDRYGIAWGARVREDPRDHWLSRHEHVDWWVEVNDISIHDLPEKPAIREYYSDWYLLDEDFPDGTTRDDVDAELVATVLEDRREYPVRSDLSLQDVSDLKTQRSTTYQDAAAAQEERVDEFIEEHDVPAPLESWVTTSNEKLQKLQDVLRVVRDHSVSSYSDIAAYSVASESSIQNYAGKDSALDGCMTKAPDTDGYQITPIGQKALSIPWSERPE